MRHLPTDGEVARWIREHHEPLPMLREVATPPQPLFPNPRAYGASRRWSEGAARRAMLAAMRAAGVSFRPNEALRHAFATAAVNRGVPMERTSAYLGHSDTKMTRRYAKLAGENLVDVTPNRPRGVE